MVDIYVDADACPVKDEVIRVAVRHHLNVWLVSDGGIRPSQMPNVQIVVVPQGADAADHWIAERIASNDICITNDIPLADACIEQGAHAIRHNGDLFTVENIGMALASRDLMQNLRETGQITGGPKPFSKADRSRFLSALETLVQKAGRKTN